MTQKGERARELFLQGYNCAQSVAGAFSEEIGLPLDTVLKLAQPFGAGMGRLREICGTFSGMLFVVGQLYGSSEPAGSEAGDTAKKRVYSIVQALAERFRAERGTIICREILGLMKNAETDPNNPSARTEEYYKKRPCARVCAESASLLERYLSENR
ncbi:MAG: C_GCAxxG_C_C family protein [Clostridiales bacterium]|nr:C_GCAxxG_C_C family protein [Clostridiales bacterium]